ncbi:HET domain-containing protein [Aspergillus vadensis CBS 113365]|uniref:HET-domain-containing protein n=1 Tax=Aspergillus vadensis (strain CBS 113365 / IMI 142717 / IBT 24658) TaxID=1448311 RepID=A0A319BD92_ASPVC|nr:HET-domain-containing protein [Aspergillus vadensis CBS 113365]PYH69924.1 HET-domain-containing protein [Aspergillus vadensis CBS 113365]
MSPEPARNSDLTGPAFTYTEVPLESPHSTTRMIRLLPNKDKDAEIECELFNYDLTSGGGADSHLYEALSYVWGSNTRSRTIVLNSCVFPVTENLYFALSRLRNRQLGRVLWVDAICINQDDLNEKTEQIPLMRTIYAQAQHVTVWLGEAYEDGDKALEALRCLAEGQDVDIRGCGALCVKLFERAWFRRIWVLQEVGVARHIYIMCGSAQINGHAFCEGLKKLDRLLDCQEMIGSVAFLIKGALLRPKYEPGSRGTFTIGELVGMYCYHNATEQHDKIFALLGLSADPITPALTPNYALPWYEVFKQVTNHIFPGCSVETWPESDIAIIKGRGWTLGYIRSVQHVSDFGHQKVKMYLNDTARSIGYQSNWDGWELQTFAQFFNPGDVIFLLQGASRPSIIRLCRDHFRIVTPAVTLCKTRPRESLGGESEDWHAQGRPSDILLAWRFPLNNNTRLQCWPKAELLDMVLAYQEQSLEAEYSRKYITRIMTGIFMEAFDVKKPEYEDIAHLLISSGTDVSTASELTKACADDFEYPPSRIMRKFFQSGQDDLSISEEMVKAVAENKGPCGYIIMELLFQLQGSSLPISEEVVEAAAGNSGRYGDQVLKAIYRHRGESFPVSKEVVRAVAGNTGGKATKILKFLFKARGKALPVSEEVLKVAAGNYNKGYKIMNLLFVQKGGRLPVTEEVVKIAAGKPEGYMLLKLLIPHRGESIPISEKVVKAAAGNGDSGREVIELLFQQEGGKLPVTEEVVKTAAGNGDSGREVIEFFFQQEGRKLPVTEEVIKTAAGNVWLGHEIMKIFFQQKGERLPISEEVIKAAAGNKVSGREVMELLFQQEGGKLPVSEEVIKVAAGNSTSGSRVLEVLFQQKGERLPVTEEVVKIAADNGDSGHELMEVLFQQKGEMLPISEEVVKAAAGNVWLGHEIMKIFFQQKGERLPISEKVVKAAAGNKYYGYHAMELLFQQRGEKLPVTEEVVKTAAMNKTLGVKILEYLLQQKGRSGLPVTEEVLRAAAENTKCGAKILEILQPERSLQTTVTESPGSSESSLSSDESDEED